MSARPVAELSARTNVRVRLTVEPDPRLTGQWLRELLAKAREWKQKQEEKEAA